MKIVIEAEADTYKEMEEVLKSCIRTLSTTSQEEISNLTEPLKYGNKLPSGQIKMTVTK